HLGRVSHIELIRETYDKTRAEISFTPNTTITEELENLWCIPFGEDCLVKILSGLNNSNKLKERNKYSRRLLDLPEDTNEILLMRQIKRTGAKALYIFKNTNDNNRRSATVYFENEENMLDSSRYTVFYYNHKLSWAAIRYNQSKNQGQQEIHVENISLNKTRSAKSLGKRKEIDQKQRGECSSFAQKRVQDIDKENKIYDNNKREERKDQDNSDSLRRSRSHSRSEEGPHYKRNKRISMRELLENLNAIAEKEEYKFRKEDSFWDHKISNCS